MAPSLRLNEQMPQPPASGWGSTFRTSGPNQPVSRSWTPNPYQSSIHGSAPMSNLPPNPNQSWPSSDLAENSKPSSSFAKKPFPTSDEPPPMEVRKPSLISVSTSHSNLKVETGLLALKSSPMPLPTLLPRPKAEEDLIKTPKSAPAPSAHSIFHTNLIVEKELLKAKESLPSSPSNLSACPISVEDLSVAPKSSPSSRSTVPANFAVEESIAEAKKASPSSQFTFPACSAAEESISEAENASPSTHSTHLSDPTAQLRSLEAPEPSPSSVSTRTSPVVEERPSEAQEFNPPIKMPPIKKLESEACPNQEKASIVARPPMPALKAPIESNNVQTRVIDLSFDASDEEDSDEAPWSARDWARLRNYRKVDELESESSEELSDDGSIHHGATARGTDSTITVRMDTPERQTGPSSSRQRKSFTSSSIEELPTSLKNQFDGWCLRKNTDYPPCVISTHSIMPLHTSRDGKPAKWMHISGEHLEIKIYKIYNFKRVSLSAANLGVMTVEGANLGIHAITRTSGNQTTQYSRYKLWLGLKGGDTDGYELTPSVLKVYGGSPSLIQENFANSKVVDSVNPLFRRTSPGTLEKSSHPSTTITEIPREVKNLFEEWYRQKGFVLPPCVSPGRGNSVTHMNSEPATWTRKSGEGLEARKLVFLDSRLGKGEFYTFVVEGDTIGPTAVKFVSNSVPGRAFYKQWVGLERGDKNGFERTKYPSIYKIRSSLITKRSSSIPPGISSGSFKSPQVDNSLSRQRSSTLTHLGADMDAKNELPFEIKTQFEAWYRRKGLIVPPGVGAGQPGALSTTQSGKLATWTHVSGEQLEARRHFFQDRRFPNHSGHMIIVQGPSHGPYLVKFCQTASTNAAVAYKIWWGVDRDNVDANGFELAASVCKLTSVPAMAKATVSPVPEVSNCLTSQSQKVSGPPQQASSNFGAAHELPQVLEDQLEAWYRKNGRIIPPVVRYYANSKPLDRTKSGEEVIWYHKSGERLKARNFRLEDKDLDLKRNQAALIVQGPTQGPYFVRYDSNTHQGVTYKIWLGVDRGNFEGFEEEPSVFRSNASTAPPILAAVVEKNTPSKKLNLKKLNALVCSGFQGDEFHEADGTPKTTETRLRSNPAKAKSYTLPTRREFMSGAFSDYSPYKRKRDEDEKVDSDLLLESFLATNPPKRPSTSQEEKVRTTPTAVGPDLPEFQAHLDNNTVLMFYSKQGGPPRIRLFGLCNSIYKLFAQALAGDVFAEGPASSRVLSVQFGNGVGTKKTMSLVENDEQDFEDLLSALKNAACWSIVGEKIQGSCTLEVKAK